MLPLVSIIIPVYNTAKYLKNCLDSVVNQSYSNIEIIVINDCSTDCSQAIMNHYAQNYHNIKIVDSSLRLLPGGARNIGLELAQGNYIYFLDSDDFMARDAISTLIHLVTVYETPIASGQHQTIIGPLNFHGNNSLKDTFIDLTQNKEMIDECNGVVWNNLYKHELISNIRFPENLLYEDNAFIYPVFTRARSWAKTDKILYYYRRNLHSITISSKLFPNERILDVYSCLEYMYNACKNIGSYEEFKDIIGKISQRIAIYPLLECCLWLGISKVDRNVVLSGLVDYIKEQYGIEDIMQVEYLMNRVIHSKRLKIKLNLLAKYLEKLSLSYPNGDNLENVRRVLKKYSK